MSVSSTTNKIIYTGSGTTGPFDFDFVIYLASDLVVEKYTIATGTTTTLTITTDYTVTIDGDGTGHIDTVEEVTSSYKLIIRRVLPITQAIDYVEGDKFPAATHEEGLDRGVMIDQQLQEQIDRAVLQNTTVSTQITLPGAVPGNALVWDDDGNIVNSDEVLVGPQGEKGDKGDTGDAGVVQSIVAGTNVTVDDTDPTNPVVSASTPKATGADIDTGTEDEEFVTPKAIADSALVFETAWTDYSATSTIVGWTSFTLKVIKYKMIGGLLFCKYNISGTSNATGVTFTLPITVDGITYFIGGGLDNGGAQNATRGSITNGTVTIAAPFSAAWTGSGTKEVYGQFCCAAA